MAIKIAWDQKGSAFVLRPKVWKALGEALAKRGMTLDRDEVGYSEAGHRTLKDLSKTWVGREFEGLLREEMEKLLEMLQADVYQDTIAGAYQRRLLGIE